jgi:hypothetical protein
VKFEYYPDEIAAAIAEAAGEVNPEIIENSSGALYDLKAICENHYNDDYYRDFYKLLEKFTAQHEQNHGVTIPF